MKNETWFVLNNNATGISTVACLPDGQKVASDFASYIAHEAKNKDSAYVMMMAYRDYYERGIPVTAQFVEKHLV